MGQRRWLLCINTVAQAALSDAFEQLGPFDEVDPASRSSFNAHVSVLLVMW
jgi:hypothetical protein